jgi:dipeptidase E
MATPTDRERGELARMAGHIIPIGGNPRGPGEGAIERYLLEVSGCDNPRVCFVPTASGDDNSYIATFYERFPSMVCRPAHFTVFRPPAIPVAELLGEADIIYVGGGSTANMLAVWRLHGIDAMLRAAHERGAVLTGSSAGANCWFEASVTDSFGNELAPLHDGLDFLPGSFCPHYDSEAQRRPIYRQLIRERVLPRGYAGEDGVAFHFHDEQLVEVVSARPDAAGYELEAVDGELVESRLPTRALGD